jgi:hypothetical protein
MVKIEKLIKLSTNSSKVRSIIKKIKHKPKKSIIGIKKYKQKLQDLKNNNKTKTSAKTSVKTHKIKNEKTHKIITRHPSVIISNMELLPTTGNNLDNTNHGNKNYVIAIPSYNRSDSIQTKTLTVLQQNNIEPSLIHIFVANKEQYDIYLQAIPKHLYGTLVIGLLGLKNQRNYINDYYPEGTHIVELDDDITSIVQLIVKDKLKSVSKGSNKGGSKSRKTMKSTKHIKFIKPIINLDAFIKHAFKICTENGSFLWGVYPIANAHFMTPTVTKDLRFIVGPMWGVINRHIKALKLTIDEKENTERTLQHWTIDGIVVRFNNVSIVTRYYKNKGGMQNEGKNRNLEAMKSAQYLHKKYPELTKVFLGKKSGVPEVKLVKV